MSELKENIERRKGGKNESPRERAPRGSSCCQSVKKNTYSWRLRGTERGIRQHGASGGAAVAVAAAAAAAAGNADAMAAAAVDAENAASVADAAAVAEAENAAALVAPAAGADVALTGGEDEGEGANTAIGEGAGAIQGGTGGQQGGFAGEGVGVPIPVADQTHENPLGNTTIIEQLAVALPKIQGWAEQVSALQHHQPGVGVGAQQARGEGISGGGGWGGRFVKS